MRRFLSYRLEAIFNLVPQDSFVADVGADHGRLVIELINKKRAKRAVAIENKRGPYGGLVESYRANGSPKNLQLIFADGLSKMSSRVDTVVIAGMGGDKIVEILYNYKNKLTNTKTIIIDSHTKTPYVRRKIIELGFYIDHEEIIIEKDHYYEIIRFVKGIKQYEEDDYEFGPFLRKEHSSEFILKNMDEIKKIDALLSQSSNVLPKEKIIELKQRRERIVKA